jgi:hypothetical protein
MRYLITTLSLATVLFCAQGCVAVAAAGAGVGTYAYVSGDLEQILEAPLDRVYDAALEVMGEMEYTINSKSKDALEASIDAEQADETSVTIRLEAKGENLTHTSIRVGLFGDEAQSALIMDKIRAKL